MTSGIETSWVHVTSEIPDGGLEAHRTADAAQLHQLARELGIVAVERLSVRYGLRALSRGRYALSGEISARVVQECVVTLEPVAADMTEPLEAEFWPAGQIPEPAEGEQDALSQPEVEPIEQHRLAVGRVVFETVAAALDPYPRAPGASLAAEAPHAAAPEARSSPFTALAGWKPKDA